MSHTPRAVKGVLDLRQATVSEQKLVTLDGEWEFYWKELLTPAVLNTSSKPKPDYLKVPDSWNGYVLKGEKITGTGFATYRLKVLLGKSYSEPLSLRLPLIYTAYSLWIDGKLEYESGKVSPAKASTQPQYRPEIITFVPAGSEVEIVIQVANFHYSSGGIRRSIEFGPESSLQKAHLWSVAIEFWLMGSILIMGLYHLGLYVIYKRSSSPLYFGIFCLLVTLRIFVTGEYTINLFFDPDWWWLIRLEYCTFILSAIAFTLFLGTVFEETFSRKVVKIAVGVSIIFLGLVLFSPPVFFTGAIVPYQLFSILVSIYGLYAIIRAWQQGIDGSLVFFLGYLTLIGTFVNDILHANAIIQTGHFISMGLFVFIFSQAFLISRRFSRAFHELEFAMNELTRTNEKLSETSALMEEQNEELWQLNKELDSFVYRTSHDLRAPIASVLGLINLSRMEKDPDQIQHYLNLKEKSLHKLDNVIRDIIDYARNKSLDLEITPVNLQTQIEEIFASHDYMENAVRIRKSLECIQDGLFYSDRKRIDVILNNLISNAIRYFNPYQEQPFIEVTVRTDNRCARIEVKDNGLGIAKEYQEKIFQMFFRIHNRGSGSGMGLYVVKETVQKLGGTISVESEINQGTLFTITLPNLAPAMATT